MKRNTYARYKQEKRLSNPIFMCVGIFHMVREVRKDTELHFFKKFSSQFGYLSSYCAGCFRAKECEVILVKRGDPCFATLFDNGKLLILPLEYMEFYDVKLNEYIGLQEAILRKEEFTLLKALPE